MEVPYIDLGHPAAGLKEEILDEIGEIIESGQFILSKKVEQFEKAFADYIGVRFAIGVNSGTDALLLSMKALGIGEGDEVITAPNSFLASAGAIALSGATPIFADVRDDLNIDPALIEKAITPQTKAIMPVHLTGRPADLDAIMKIASKHNIHIIEDAAQAVGATFNGQKVGSFGIAGCFSMHPLKNLNAAGDAGVITTNDKKLNEALRKMRNHGLVNRDESDFWSYNSRLDAIQAAILNVKLKYLNDTEEKKRNIAVYYQEHLNEYVEVPITKPSEKAVYHTFIIQTDKRDALKQYLSEHQIDSKVHYPIPIHLQKAASALKLKSGDFPIAETQAEKILSLPIYPELTYEQMAYVVETIIAFYQNNVN